MGSTIQITHSKNLSFKKLSFLYLVFILFLFFSSPGQYVVHYTHLSNSQTDLNSRLISKLKSFNSVLPQEMDLKNTTLECYNGIDALEQQYAEYAEKNLVTGDKLRDNNFAEKIVRKGQLAPKLQGILDQYLASFVKISKRDLSADLVSLRDFTSNDIKTIDFFFKETPNGVVNAMFEHFKTVFLYNSLIELTHQNIDLPKFELISLKDAKFIEKFRRSLVLGESLELAVKPEKLGLVPTVKINGTLVEIKTQNNGIFNVSYKPYKPGPYALEVVVGDKRLLSGFTVLKPEFRYIMDRSNLNAKVGSTCELSLDSQYFPKSGVSFSSPKASVKRVKNALKIVPIGEGVFEIFMKVNDQVVDKVTLFAHAPGAIKVGLMDIGGNLASLEKANRLESTNTFWQVVNFQMTVVDPSGNKKSLKSATRYLRNELRELESKAVPGSTIIFDNIKLVGQTSGSTQVGQPLIMVK